MSMGRLKNVIFVLVEMYKGLHVFSVVLVVVVGIDNDTLDVVKPGAQDKVELGVVV